MQASRTSRENDSGRDSTGNVNLERWKIALASGDEDQRVMAAIMLGKPGPDANLRTKWLYEILNDPSAEVQKVVIESLRQLELRDDRHLILLANKLLRASNQNLCQTIVRSILEADTYPPQVVRVLTSAIGSDHVSAFARMGAVAILGTGGPATIMSLCRALASDPAVEVRRMAGRALRGTAAAIEPSSPTAKKVSAALAFAVRDEEDSEVLDLIIETSRILKGLSPLSPAHAVSNKAVAPSQLKPYTEEVSESGGEDGDEGNLISNPERVGEIIALLDEATPENFTKAYSKAAQLMRLAKQEIAERLSGPFNAKLRRMPQKSYEEKKTIASWVNSELREIGLAIKCPKTGRPAILIADIRSASDDTSRFRIEVTDEEGKKIRTWTGNDLSGLTLELREDEPRKEGPTVRRHRE